MATRVGHWLHDRPEHPGMVYIGRGSKWGNPYTYPGGAGRSQHSVIEAAEPLAAFEAHVLRSPDLLAALHELRGKVLGCYCVRLADANTQTDLFGEAVQVLRRERCHGHVLARLADRTPTEEG